MLLHCSRKNGFSLVEILVAVVIMAILIGIVTTELARISAKSDGTRCIANMRNISTAMLTYAAEHNGNFPPYSLETSGASNFGQEKRWPTLFFDSLGKETFRCHTLKGPRISELSPSGQHVSYGYNSQYLGSTQRYARNSTTWIDSGRPTAKLAEVNHPSRTLLLAETLITSGMFANKAGFYQIGHWPDSQSVLRADPRHGPGILIAWVDGHVSMEKTDLDNDAIPMEWLSLEKSD